MIFILCFVQVKDRYCKNLDSLGVGDEIGVVCKRGGGLHILINGEDQGEASPNVPSKCYAVVDVYGLAERVKIVGPGEEEEKEDEPTVDEKETSVRVESGKKEEVEGSGVAEASVPKTGWFPRLKPPQRKCPFQELCRRFIGSLAIPGMNVVLCSLCSFVIWFS